MTKRQITIISGIVVLIFSILISNWLKNSKAPPERILASDAARPVRVEVVENKEIELLIPLTGRLISFGKTEIASEVSGVYIKSGNDFREGNRFEANEVMVKLDDTELKMNFLASKSSFLNTLLQTLPDIKSDFPDRFQAWENYVSEFNMTGKLAALPVTEQAREKYFLASRNIYNQFYNLKSSEAKLEKFTIRAPFRCVVTESQINPGSLIRTGQRLGEIISTGNFEFETSVNSGDVKYIREGLRVSLTSSDYPGIWLGKIVRISDRIDPMTQTVKVFVAVFGNDLKDGMYLNGVLHASVIDNAFKLPSRLLMNTNNVFTVLDSVVISSQVDVIRNDNDSVIVRGLQNGIRLLIDVPEGMHDGMIVKPSIH